MAIFRLWAPRARDVSVVPADGRSGIPMHSQKGGWWWAEVAEAGPGTAYRYSLDGGEPLPDPRSPWQPEGVFGPSCLVDHATFPWSDASFRATPLGAAVLYELHIGTFTPEGTFTAAIDHLDHLRDLGVTHVELMPVHQFSGSRGWGYDGVDLFAPHAAYGRPEDLKTLVNTCHARGLAVIMDVVYNHLGPAGNYLHRFGPYFTDRYATPWGPAVNLDGPGSDEVRRFLCDNALLWLRDYHCDGLRLDAVHALLDSSAVHLLEQMTREVEALASAVGRPLIVIAESALNDPRLVRPREAGGYGLDAQWSDDFHHALHTLLTGERDGYYQDFSGSLAELAHTIQHVFLYDGRYSPSRDRLVGRPVGELPGCRFLGFLQNHDQVGNRAQGDRISQQASPGLLKLAAALVLTAPFTPMLFQGEEWGASTPFQYFTDHQDPELGRIVSEGRRAEFAGFGWKPEQVPDPQSPDTFACSKLNWNEVAQAPHAALLAWYQELIALRRATPALTDTRLDRVQVSYNQEAGWLTMRRGKITLACNLAAASRPVPLPAGTWRLRLASADEVDLAAGVVILPGESVAILEALELAQA